MTKPTKKTVDYFPHDVRHGKSIFITEQRFGNDGYAAWFKLLEQIGSHEGHFLNFADVSQWQYYIAYANLEAARAEEIISLFATLGMIDPKLWQDARIVWSENFINNLSDLYSRRKINLPQKSDINTAIAPVSGINDSIYPQIKVNKSILNNTKEETTTTPPPPLQGGAPAESLQDQGKGPEKAQQGPAAALIEAVAIEAIKYLNLKAGRNFRAETAGLLKHPKARAKEGATLDLLKMVVDFKVWDWKTRDRGLDAKDMTPWLRPDTLFNSTKFWVYAEEAASLKMKKQVKEQVRQRMIEEGKNQEVVKKELDAATIAEIDRRKAALKAKYGPIKYLYHVADPIEGYMQLM